MHERGIPPGRGCDLPSPPRPARGGGFTRKFTFTVHKLRRPARMHFARVYYSPKGSPTQVEAGDLYFARGRPLLVFSWRRTDGERVPEECIELDPAKLQRASSNGTIFRYEGPVRS